MAPEAVAQRRLTTRHTCVCEGMCTCMMEFASAAPESPADAGQSSRRAERGLRRGQNPPSSDLRLMPPAKRQLPGPVPHAGAVSAASAHAAGCRWHTQRRGGRFIHANTPVCRQQAGPRVQQAHRIRCTMDAGNVSNRTKCSMCARTNPPGADHLDASSTVSRTAATRSASMRGDGEWRRALLLRKKRTNQRFPRSLTGSLDECPSEEERSPNGGEVAMADIRAFFMG